MKSMPNTVSRRLLLCSVALALILWGLIGVAPVHAGQAVILSTTTSTQDSGLLDVLVPMFEKTTGYTVKTISVGTGQALALAAKGEADVCLVHAPDSEKKYVADGLLLNRRLVMHNDFIIVGPAEDPAKIKGLSSAVDAMKRIAEAKATFVSRGRQLGHAPAREEALERGEGRAGGRVVSAGRPGDGRHAGDRIGEARPTR